MPTTPESTTFVFNIASYILICYKGQY
jgi:hypothetical protein